MCVRLCVFVCVCVCVVCVSLCVWDGGGGGGLGGGGFCFKVNILHRAVLSVALRNVWTCGRSCCHRAHALLSSLLLPGMLPHLMEFAHTSGCLAPIVFPSCHYRLLHCVCPVAHAALAEKWCAGIFGDAAANYGSVPACRRVQLRLGHAPAIRHWVSHRGTRCRSLPSLLAVSAVSPFTVSPPTFPRGCGSVTSLAAL